ncbi:MAG: hypothetical protein LC775_05830, partial [Acidobacteria bacterium]|nr:hypothetical protein [Acidobacteriota bacterium]
MRHKASTTRILLALVVLIALLVSSQAADAAAPERVPGPELKCGHPYPCDYTWAGPTGPFKVRPAERVTV